MKPSSLDLRQKILRAYDHQLGSQRALAAGVSIRLDNLSAPKASGVPPALARRRVRWLCWPPSSPELSPMARWVRKLKTALRAAQARTREARETAMRQALETVTAAEARTWFTHGGYALSSCENRSRQGAIRHHPHDHVHGFRRQ